MGRFIFVVLDGVGVGALPDAADYSDLGSDTLGNLSRVVSLHLPFLERCGLGNIVPLQGVPPVEHPLCLPGRLATHSAGKDTTVGHWEHMGLVTAQPFPTYPEGFPPEVIRPFEAEIGRAVLGNRAASGTAIIAELGEIHMQTARPIVYTSADSVFQVAAHVDTVPLAELYSWCQIARRLLRGPHAVARVIARPFSGLPGSFARTRDRRDYSLAPPAPTYLDLLTKAGSPVLALGKVAEVFAGRGISTRLPVRSNDENLALLTDLVAGHGAQASFEQGLLFTNLVDFDALWGHRNDVEGFARGLESVDAALPSVVDALRDGDRLLITADHGVDPTTPSTDHSREYVPLLLFPRPCGPPEALYDGALADTGATAYEHLTGRRAPLSGTCVLRLQPERGWRRYTPHQSEGGTGLGRMGARVGQNEVCEAAQWLLENVGLPPKTAVILGSGLSPMCEGPPISETLYSAIPHWLVGGVPGHANVLEEREWDGREVALLRGRIHAYEGYDPSEIQLVVRTLAAWGVEDLVLTSSSGVVAPSLGAGTVVSADEVLEFHSGGVLRESPVRRLRVDGPAVHSLRHGVHASLPGPQYETPAELGLLRRLGADTVSMSPAQELRAARQEGLRVATLAVVVNAGDTTHSDVLESAARASRGLSEAITALLGVWQATASLY